MGHKQANCPIMRDGAVSALALFLGGSLMVVRLGKEPQQGGAEFCSVSQGKTGFHQVLLRVHYLSLSSWLLSEFMLLWNFALVWESIISSFGSLLLYGLYIQELLYDIFAC